MGDLKITVYSLQKKPIGKLVGYLVFTELEINSRAKNKKVMRFNEGWRMVKEHP